MIRATTSPAVQAFVVRLTAKARAIGRAKAETRLRAARSDPDRWRAARLLWPLFGDR